MKKNIGNGDRFLRVIVGVIAIILGLSGKVDGNLKWIVLGIGAIMVLTSFVQYCPLYSVLGINTCKAKSK